MGYCPHCNKLYRTREGLKEHILVVHEKSTPFHCDECPRKFGIQFKLQSHKLIVHSKKNCEICGQQAYNAFKLTRHKAAAHRIVTKDVYLCDTCQLFFKHPRNLAKHKETKHPQWKLIFQKSTKIKRKASCSQYPNNQFWILKTPLTHVLLRICHH